MSFNWFDVVLIIIIALAVIIGVIKGLIRQIIGIAAVVVGFILAMTYFGLAAEFLSQYIKNNMFSQLLGFLAIFFGFVIAGGILSWLLSKLMKGPFKFVNHSLGAALGFIKGILICGVIVLALMMFPVNQNHLYSSELAPYCARMTRVVYRMIPEDVKTQFNDTYDKIVKGKREQE
jgi:membrane protein required for colicin V production